MENPFVYGEVVPVEAFVDREDELARLVADLSEGQKVFLISPRRYGKSSLVHRALAQLARRGLDTLELTVASFSSYVAFLEGYARALAGLESRARSAGWFRDCSARRGRNCVTSPDPAAAPAGRRLSVGPQRPRRRPARRRSVRPAGADRRRPRPASGDRVRRVPGRADVQRRQRRTGAARGGAAPAPGRLRLCRLRADADGTHDRSAPAVLQRRAGHAPRTDPGADLRAPSSTRASAGPASRPSPGSARRSSSSPATCRTMSSDSRTRRGTMRGPAGRGS